MIYVPDVENYSCFVVRNENVIRAYTQVPKNNTTIRYRDYYYNSNYLYNDGEQSFSNYTTLPICLDNNIITNEVYYRNDFDSILIIFFIFAFICVWCPLKIFMRLFRRFN